MAERGGFAGLLKALRDQAGLSQNGLAERSGVAVSTVRQFEYGMREPTYGTLVKLARGLGVSLAAFDPGEQPGASPAVRPNKATPEQPPQQVKPPRRKRPRPRGK
jgi:transcriptional regulator with XRE-family HTH domain